MRRLLALQVGPARVGLPLADHSAAVLAEILLQEPGPAEDPPAVLVRQVASDPPLAAWVVGQAVCSQWCWPRTAAEAAAWLARNALDLLERGLAPKGPADELSGAETERWAGRVARGLQLADLAARLGGSQRDADAERAYFEGLLHEAPSWFAEGPHCGWVEIFAENGAAPEAAWAVQAASILDGRCPPPAPECDPRECRRRTLAAVERWLQPLPGAAAHLPALAARLARLRQLETRFQETLEAEKLESLAEFAAGAGHEINNPLAIISGRAQVLLRDETDPERRRELASIHAQARRADEMIADLRLFARPPRPEPAPTDLAALVDSLLAELAPQAAERAVELVRTGDPGPLEAEVDATQLRVALQALCRNAFEAIGREGRVEIAIRGLERTVEIRVADDGPGIPPQHRRHIFDPFYSSRQAGRGLGFGLSKCWRIVAQHGGRIAVENGTGRGAVLAITLPRRYAGRERK